MHSRIRTRVTRAISKRRVTRRKMQWLLIIISASRKKQRQPEVQEKCDACVTCIAFLLRKLLNLLTHPGIFCSVGLSVKSLHDPLDAVVLQNRDYRHLKS